MQLCRLSHSSTIGVKVSLLSVPPEAQKVWVSDGKKATVDLAGATRPVPTKNIYKNTHAGSPGNPALPPVFQSLRFFTMRRSLELPRAKTTNQNTRASCLDHGGVGLGPLKADDAIILCLSLDVFTFCCPAPNPRLKATRKRLCGISKTHLLEASLRMPSRGLKDEPAESICGTSVGFVSHQSVNPERACTLRPILRRPLSPTLYLSLNL